MSLTPGTDSPRPEPDPGEDHDPLRDWGRTARLCVLYLAQGVPPVLLLWLTSRR
jgi:hypothetical protein